MKKSFLSVSIVIIVFIIFSGCQMASDSGSTGTLYVPADKTIFWEEDGSGFIRFSTNETKNCGYGFRYQTLTSKSPMTVVETRLKKMSGSTKYGYGIFFCYTDSDNLYNLFITTDKYYLIRKCLNGNWSTIKPWTLCQGLYQGYGVENIIKIERNSNGNFIVYFNNQYETNFYDSSFDGGDSGYDVGIGPASDEHFPYTPVDVRFHQIDRSAKAFLSYGFQGIANGVISGNTILVNAPAATDITKLQATFTVSYGASVKIGSVTQNSGSTVNNFSNDVVYTITARDGTTQNYTVTVNTNFTTQNYDYHSSSPVYPVDFTGNSSINININNLDNRSIYLVKANYSTDVIDPPNTGGSADIQNLIPVQENNSTTDGFSIKEKEEISRFNNNPPPIDRNIESQNITRQDIITYGNSTGAGYLINETNKFFWVQKKDGSWVQKPATLRAIGTYCYIWVDINLFNKSSSSTIDGVLTGTQVNAMQSVFDNTIFNNLTNIFGYEYGGGSGGNGGVDADQHISILIYDIDEQGADVLTKGGYVGYFWGKDYYPDGSNKITPLRSNQMEIFYIDNYFFDNMPSLVFSSLAHEYQHMVHFNQKFIKQDLNDDSWINEMCSMVAEDLLWDKLGITLDYSPQKRIRFFNSDYSLAGITEWTSNTGYSVNYVFGAFLARNYGGALLFQNIVQNNTVGMQAISDALASQNAGTDFNGVFTDYLNALIYSTPPAGSSVKVFQAAGSQIGSVAYHLNAFDIYSFQMGYTSKSGPRFYEPWAQVALRPYGFSLHSDNTWQNLTGSKTITLVNPSDSNIKFYVMVK